MTRSQKRYLLWAFLIGLFGSVLANQVARVRADEPAPIIELVGNETSDVRVELGMSLFFDADLSSNKTISCSTCHLPDRAFTQNLTTSIGVGGAVGRRNAPTIINACYKRRFFWDGRAGPHIESQPAFPLLDAGEQGMTAEGIVSYLKGEPEYIAMFKEAYDEAPTMLGVVKALSCFMREIISFNAPINKWLSGKTWELDERMKLGGAIFINCSEATGYDKAKKIALMSSAKGPALWKKGLRSSCTTCHNGQDFSTDFDGIMRLHNIGAGEYDVDLGGQIQTSDDVGQIADEMTDAYVTPTLREHFLTAPYGHRGQWLTTRQVVDFKAAGGEPSRFLDKMVYSYVWTEQEKQDLVYFLQAAFQGDFKERIAELGIITK